MNDGALDFDQLANLTGNKRGRIDVACPLCGPQCKSSANRNRKVLRVWDDGEFITFNCARCGEKGWAMDKASASQRPAREQKPAPAEPVKDMAAVAAALWQRAVPLAGSPAERYLCGRGCFLVDSPNLRFLPPKGDYHPAMIARFGQDAISGIHLTRLKADGSGKADSEKDKIMLGPSQGQPIGVCDNPERGELIVAEGIEDAASLGLVTGWSAWAAGSAGRLAPVVSGASSFERVYLAVDNDKAGLEAVARARMLRPDVVPINFAKALGVKERFDANKSLLKYGPDSIVAVIEWCEAQARHAHGEIGFDAMQRAMGSANDIFSKLAEAA